MRIKKHELSKISDGSRISVIVCAHNEMENLKTLVPILLNQDYPDFEILITLDRSTDGSLEYLKTIDRVTVLDFQDIPDQFNSKKYALSKALQAANGRWVLLTDADCRPSTTWISHMSHGMTSDKDVVLGISPYITCPGVLNQVIQYETFLTALEFCSKAIEGKPYMGIGRNLAYRKESFEAVGGFLGVQAVTGGDDDLLVQRMANAKNVSVILSDQSHADSIPKKDWRSFLKQKTRHYSVGKYYAIKATKRESFRWSIQFAFWILFVAGLTIAPTLSLGIWAVSFVIRLISFNIVADQLAKRFNPQWVPFVDFVYAVFLPLVSLRSLLVKNVKWN